MRPIKEEDIVTVVMTQAGQCFDFQTGTEIYEVTVSHRPVDTGDLWYFRAGMIEFAVNPCSSDFVGLILEVRDDV